MLAMVPHDVQKIANSGVLKLDTRNGLLEKWYPPHFSQTGWL
jgi:hypothetical protein